ncbi:uncharacterized protein isoform X1 [Rhodnius prolixus]
MDHKILYILMLVTYCSTAHIPAENSDDTSISDENIGDCTIDNVTYANGTKVPSPGPCEECHCRSSEVVCSMIKCKPNTSGCQVMQQANHCCPQYKCECEFNGRMYNNGEKLERPDDPCWVCYCKGGEVMCTSITCYERNDCTPHFVPGQCCPKYDHCPIENQHTLGTHGNNSNSSNFSGKREMQPWLLTVSSNNQTAPTISNMETHSPNNKYPQTIKIIEVLPTQLPPLQNGGSKVTMGPTIPTKNSDHVELLSAKTPIATQENSDTTGLVSQFSATTLKEDKEEAVKNEENLSSTISPEESDGISLSDMSHFEENITDIINESSSTVVNDVDRESIPGINNESETSTSQGQVTTISQSSTIEEQQPTPQRLHQVDGEVKEIDKTVILNSSENKELNVENKSNEHSLMHNDQSSDMSEEFQTMNTNYGQYSGNESAENNASDENTTGDVELISATETTFTSEDESEHNHSEEDSGIYTSRNSVYDNVSPTKNTIVPEYVLFGQMRDQESDSSGTSNKNQNVNSAYTEYHDLATTIPKDKLSIVPEIQPDSEHYTTVLPEKFDANLIEFNTENYFVDSTEGSGFDLVSGWTYADPTSEVYNEVGHSSQTQTSTGEFSSGSESFNELPTTEGAGEGYVNRSEILPTKNPNEASSSETPTLAEQSTSSEDASSASAEYLTDINDNFKKSTIAFPSILKLNNQIQFLKIEDQQTTDDKENTPIAKIGIYNPKNPNNLANLVTVVKENNAELEQQFNNDKVMAKQEESYTPHILLTPNDLKTLAEILIHEKIIPPFLQDQARSTNAIEQRSIDQEIMSGEAESEETSEESEEKSSTENEEITSPSSMDEEDSNTPLGNNTFNNDLVEIIKVSNLSSKAKEDLVISETSSPTTPRNLTDLETWAQNVLDKITSNILVPLTGIEFVDSNVTSTESNFSKENFTRFNENSSEEENVTSSESEEDFTESNVSETTVGSTSEPNEVSEVNPSSTETSEEHNDDRERKQNEDSVGEEKQAVQDINTSRQSRIPSNLISPLLSASMLDDKDIILLQDFFKKNLNSK